MPVIITGLKDGEISKKKAVERIHVFLYLEDLFPVMLVTSFLYRPAIDQDGFFRSYRPNHGIGYTRNRMAVAGEGKDQLVIASSIQCQFPCMVCRNPGGNRQSG